MEKYFKSLIWITFILFFNPLIFSQDRSDSLNTGNSKGDTLKNRFFENTTKFFRELFEVSESSKEFDKDFDKKFPAKFSIIIPDTGNNYMMADVAIGLSFKGTLEHFEFLERDTKNINFSVNFLPFVEYHAITQISKKQEIFKSGFKLNLAFYQLFKPVNLRLLLNSSLNDSRDYEKENWSTQFSTYLNIAFKSTRRTFLYYFLPQTYSTKIGDRFFWYSYIPSIGYEYSNLYRKPENQKKGYIHTLFAGIQLNLFLFEKYIQFYGDFQYRQYVKNTTSALQKFYRLYKFGGCLSIIKAEKYEILFGYDYVNGENPWEGFEKQKYSQISLKFKL